MELAGPLQIVSSGIIIGSIYALIAVGLNLIYGTMRLLNIAHGEMIMIGAYITYWLFVLFGIAPIYSILIVLFLSALIGILVCRVLFIQMIKSTSSLNVLEANSLLIFFSLSIIFSNVASLLWSTDIRGYTYLTDVITIAEVPLMYNRLLALGISLIVCSIFIYLIHKTMLGKAIRALIQEREAAQLVGIPSEKIYYYSFAFAFALAGLAGSLISMFYELTPFMGMPYTVTAFVVIVLGGLGNITGSMLGGFLLGIFEAVGVGLTSPGLRPILTYSLFIAIILWRPEGIFMRKGRV